MLRDRDKDNQEMDLEVHSFVDQKPSWGKNLGCVSLLGREGRFLSFEE